jgi:hypothetical protein
MVSMVWRGQIHNANKRGENCLKILPVPAAY